MYMKVYIPMYCLFGPHYNPKSIRKGNVKQLFSRVMNDGKRNGITDSFFVKFKTEC